MELLMTKEDIDHPKFLKHFLIFYRESMNQVQKHPSFSLDKNNHHLLSQTEKEALSILKFTNKIFGLITDLERTHTFVRRLPLKDFYEKNEIDQIDYIKYHFEVFVHKAHTILEVKKLWLNDFYKIGLNEKDCSWNNLKGNAKIQASGTKRIVEAYYNSFKSIIEFRHRNTHRAYFDEKESFELQLDLQMHKHANQFDPSIKDDLQEITPEFIVNYKMKKYRKDKLHLIETSIKAARTYSNSFIDHIIVAFLKELGIKF